MDDGLYSAVRASYLFAVILSRLGGDTVGGNRGR